MSRKQGMLRILAAVIAGGLLVLAYPHWNVGVLVWVWMLPWLWALWTVREKRAGWRGFGLGWLAGMAFFGGNLSWLWTVSGLGALVLGGYLALFFGLWGAFAATRGHPQRSGGVRCAFANAAFWCGVEWLRGWLFTGFGWNGVGVAFHQTTWLAQGADLMGISGLAFLPVFLQVTAAGFVWRRMSGDKNAAWWRRDLAVALGLMAVMSGYGAWRCATVGKGEVLRLNALMVQLNVPQVITQVLWAPEQVHMAYEDDTTAALTELRQRGENGVPDWVVWPESCLAGRVMRSDDGGWGMAQENWETIRRVGDAAPVTFVMGLNELEAETQGEELVMKEDPRVWNSLVVLPPDGSLRSFRKHHLVMFGEYIPLLEQLPFLKKVYEQQAGIAYGGSFTPGESLDPIAVEVRGTRIGIVPSICFEDTVPRLLRKFVRDGPQVIVNVTNDGWFGTSDAAAQQFANARFRAIELRLPMLRCANTGVTAALDGCGRTLHPDGGPAQVLLDKNGNHFTRGWLLGQVDLPLQAETSAYVLAGDWLVILLGVAGLLTGARKRPLPEPSSQPA